MIHYLFLLDWSYINLGINSNQLTMHALLRTCFRPDLFFAYRLSSSNVIIKLETANWMWRYIESKAINIPHQHPRTQLFCPCKYLTTTNSVVKFSISGHRYTFIFFRRWSFSKCHLQSTYDDHVWRWKYYQRNNLLDQSEMRGWWSAKS